MAPLTTDASTRTILSRWRSILADPSGLRPLRIGIAASYTVEPLLPALGCFLADRGLAATFVVTPFNQIYQSLVDPQSTLREAPLDLTLVLPRLEELCGRALHELSTLAPEAISTARGASRAEVAQLASVVASYARTSNGPVICGNFAKAPSSPLGVLDATHEASEGQLRRELNVDLWRSLSQTHVITVDVEDAVAQCGAANAYDDRMWHVSRHPYSVAFGKQLAYWISRTIAPLFVAPAKVIVLDLDNTLWGGVIGEDGIGGIALGDSGLGSAYVAFQEALLAYRNQGVLLCVASKNNERDALEVFDKHSAMRIRREHLAAYRINWNRKSDSLVELSRELNVGVDSIVFIDDSPTECEEVRHVLPQVTVLQVPSDPALIVAALRSVPALDRVALTSEDRARAEQYRIEFERQSVAPKAGSTARELSEYLRSLGLKVTVRRPTTDESARVAQLTQKTNQFNLTTIRRTEPEIDALMSDPTWRVFVLTASDRFGDYGLVGVCIVRAAERLEIDSFLLSCRILGRGVETAFLACVLRDLSTIKGDTVYANLVETPKNVPVRQFLPSHGFAHTPEGKWKRPVNPESLNTPHIEIAT